MRSRYGSGPGRGPTHRTLFSNFAAVICCCLATARYRTRSQTEPNTPVELTLNFAPVWPCGPSRTSPYRTARCSGSPCPPTWFGSLGWRRLPVVFWLPASIRYDMFHSHTYFPSGPARAGREGGRVSVRDAGLDVTVLRSLLSPGCPGKSIRPPGAAWRPQRSLHRWRKKLSCRITESSFIHVIFVL